MAGIAVLLAGPDFALGPGKLPGICLAVAAAILFAFGTVSGMSAIALPPVALTAWQVGLGCAPMLIAGILFEHPQLDALGPAGWASMAYMTVVPMGVCYLSWFAASRRLPAPTAATGMLLVPIVGVLSAAPIAGEPVGIRQALALALTLGGVFLAVRRPARPA
jgi:drug/metabolite transporter (DMT)-like permease